MSDPAQIPASLQDLGDAIRNIERESGQSSQLAVIVGDDKYLVGDLRKRAGKYLLEMDDRYKQDPFEEKTIENPHKKLAGSYESFDALKQAIEKTQERHEGESVFSRINGEAVYLVGSPDHGYSPAVLDGNMGTGGGLTYKTIGRIIFPLLQDREQVSVEKIKI